MTLTETVFADISTDDNYPKTLLIRNSVGGMIWQIYHVEERIEAVKLSKCANSNGFYGITLEDYQPEHEQTWPDWRDKCDFIKK